MQPEASLRSNSKQFQAALGNSELFEVAPRNETNAEFSRKKNQKKNSKKTFGKLFPRKFRIRFVARGYLKLPRVTQSCLELLGVTS